MQVTDQRRHRRFELRLPLELVRAGSSEVSETAETRNLSSGGVLFITGQTLAVGSPIEYFITLPSDQNEGIRLHCVGKVVRRQLVTAENGTEEPTAIAATLERYEFLRPED